MPELLGLIIREAGKSVSNAVAELREAVDFLRYYGAQVRDSFDDRTHVPLGPVVCISPWNFPLAIFTGQVAAALAAGNVVLAKPAEETPLIAAQAVGILHTAGVPADALQLLPGMGEVGARLVADERTRGVLFTGSTEVARLIQEQLARRLNPDSTPVPLIAETGGQNALVVDSSALAEQVVADVLVSAFDSAGQRCSSLRVLCLQADVADRTLNMLKGAVAELAVGNPDRLSTDVGPVISADARDGILAHVEAMRAAGRRVHQGPLRPGHEHGTFVPPTIIEIGSLSELTREVFGPVLHVLRFPREGMDAVIDAVNASGYGLTFGIHSRIDETVVRATARAGAGNVYVNRNLVGAVVGVQPFGGHGLSGTGPKAGGPLYLRRLLSRRPDACPLPAGALLPAVKAWHGLLAKGAESPVPVPQGSPAEIEIPLTGPVGEENLYRTEPRGTVFCRAASSAALLRQVGAALATGNRVLVLSAQSEGLPTLPQSFADRIVKVDDPVSVEFDAVLFEGDKADLVALAQELAGRPGPIVAIHVAGPHGSYPLEWLVRERALSTDTTAAGGNANLMMIG